MKKWEKALSLGLAVALLWSAATIQPQANWWCVVYYDLCRSAMTDHWEPESDQPAPSAQDAPRYELKFRTAELWQIIREKLGK